MKRIIIICEGETEKTFCQKILSHHFQTKGIYIQAPLIKRSKGGIVKWSRLKSEIKTYLLTETSAYITTFIDYYGLRPTHNFPCWEDAEAIQDPNARMNSLEEGMLNDINEEVRHRFIPYLQLHEFEGLLFNDITVFYDQIPQHDIIGIEELKQIFRDYKNPELINNGRQTSPSHRLERIIKGYSKVVYGDILAEAIGLHRMRNKSPRFNTWLTKLENI